MTRKRAKSVLGREISTRLAGKSVKSLAQKALIPEQEIKAVFAGKGRFERATIVFLVAELAVPGKIAKKYISVIFMREDRHRGVRWCKATRKRRFAGCRR